MTEHSTVVHCAIKGCCFAIVTTRPAQEPWLCPQHIQEHGLNPDTGKVLDGEEEP